MPISKLSSRKPILDENRIIRKLSIASSVEEKDHILSVMHMSEENLHYVFEHWVLEQGWYPTQHSVPATYRADPKGFYLLFKDEEPVASLSAVCDEIQKSAFLGLYIVPKEYRGKGYGKTLWNMVVPPLLEQGYTLGLNAAQKNLRILADESYYEKWGFTTIQLDEVWQYPEKGCTPLINFQYPHIRPYAASDLEKVIAYDASVYGAVRKAFIKEWIEKENTIVYISFDSKGSVVNGYGVISSRISAKDKEESGYRIGPVYAKTPALARQLLELLVATTQKRPIVLDLPGSNISFRETLIGMGFHKTSSMACMSNPPRIAKDVETYAKVSLAFYKR